MTWQYFLDKRKIWKASEMSEAQAMPRVTAQKLSRTSKQESDS